MPKYEVRDQFYVIQSSPKVEYCLKHRGYHEKKNITIFWHRSMTSKNKYFLPWKTSFGLRNQQVGVFWHDAQMVHHRY